MAITGKADLDAADIPQSSVMVPGNPKPVLMRGSTNVSTDNNNNTTTPASFNLEQIGEVLFTLGQKIKDGSISVAIASDQIVSVVSPDTSATGPVTNDNDTVAIVCPGGQSTALAKITTSNLNGTLLFEASPDGGTTWDIIQGTKVDTNAQATSVAGTGGSQAAGTWRFNISGYTNFHVKLHPVTSGTATILLRLSQGVQDVAIRNATQLGQNTKNNSTSVVLASDQSSVSNPLTIEQASNSAVRQSLAFVASSGVITATGGPYMALSLFNPNGSGKTIYIYRMPAWYAVTVTHPAFLVYKQASDPSGAWTSPTTITPVNLDMGYSGSASVAVCKATSVGNLASLAGTLLYSQDNTANNLVELIGNSGLGGIRVPANSGVTVYVNTLNTSVFQTAMFYIEQ